MPHLGLTADEVLTTTRAVRKRLDLTRPVDPEELRECLEIALQAPTGANRQNWHFVVVTNPTTIAALGDLYRRGIAGTRDANMVLTRIEPSAATAEAYGVQTGRVIESSEYLFGIIDKVPGMLIPCITGRPLDGPLVTISSQLASVIPASWSFMLAARNRGIGTVWTSCHLPLEQEAAELLGIPYPEVMQVALIPFGYTVGTSFKPARREPLDEVVHFDRW
jgi:nitroreductase